MVSIFAANLESTKHFTIRTHYIAYLMNHYHKSFQKRFLDLGFTLILLPFVILVLALTMILLFVTNGPPVFYTQKRVGKNGKVFKMYKLRTMKRKFKSGHGTRHSNKDITRIGFFLRITRLDELPQIINIVKGQMSWVGPRPEVPYYVEQFSLQNEDYKKRHEVLPGITGLAQVKYPNATPEDNLKKLSYDLEYIEKADLKSDLRLLFLSFFAVWK